jgi:L-threonylcarbamoyladenylate synthase
LYRLTKNVPPIAKTLIDKFWPGPLTLVLKKSAVVPDIVTAGRNTVAVRMPANKIALSLIKAAGTPIAAPSANKFGSVSPTTAENVIDGLGNKVDMVIDGGRTKLGVESTVLDLSGHKLPYRLLRPGTITLEQLNKTIGKVLLAKHAGKIMLSPGMFPKHYAPKAKLLLVKKNDIAAIKRIVKKYVSDNKKVGIMGTTETLNKIPGLKPACSQLGPGSRPDICAYNLYNVLHKFDKQKVDVIIAESINLKGLGLAVMDRLTKASGNKQKLKIKEF